MTRNPLSLSKLSKTKASSYRNNMLIGEKNVCQGVHGRVLGDSSQGNKRRIVDKGSHLTEKIPPSFIWKLQNECNGETGIHYLWKFVRNSIINLSVSHLSILSINFCLQENDLWHVFYFCHNDNVSGSDTVRWRRTLQGESLLPGEWPKTPEFI